MFYGINFQLPLLQQEELHRLYGVNLGSIQSQTRKSYAGCWIIPQAICSRYGLKVGAKMVVIVCLLLLVFFPISYPISKIETRTLEEVKEVLHYASQTETSVTQIMLDNMVVPLPNGDVYVSMLMINGRFETEASGNVTLDTVKKIGQTGVTYISSGALTHSVKALDISLKIDTELALQVGRRTKRA